MHFFSLYSYAFNSSIFQLDKLDCQNRPALQCGYKLPIITGQKKLAHAIHVTDLVWRGNLLHLMAQVVVHQRLILTSVNKEHIKISFVYQMHIDNKYDGKSVKRCFVVYHITVYHITHKINGRILPFTT